MESVAVLIKNHGKPPNPFGESVPAVLFLDWDRREDLIVDLSDGAT